jgi:hypothetical protein
MTGVRGQRVSGRGFARVLLLFGLLAAVFAMHTVDAGHDLNAAPSMTAIVSGHGGAAPIADPAPGPVSPSGAHSTGAAGHDHSHDGAACLAILVTGLGLAGALLGLRTGGPRQAVLGLGPRVLARLREKAAGPPTAPEIWSLGVCRT